jgi:ribosome-binding protein aMBF1 (putative translation factor)
MKASKFTEAQIAFVLKQAEGGAPVHSHWAPALASTRSELYQSLLAALIQARKDAGITQVQLAERISQRQTFVWKYEKGERRLDVAEYIAIARAIGAEPAELMQQAESEAS